MLELDLVSHKWQFCDTGHNFVRSRQIPPPRRMNPTHGFRLGDVEVGVWGRMRSPARNRRRRPLLDTLASIIKKKNSKKSEKTGFRRTMGTDGQRLKSCQNGENGGICDAMLQ